jgi:hypothetical protein
LWIAANHCLQLLATFLAIAVLCEIHAYQDQATTAEPVTTYARGIFKSTILESVAVCFASVFEVTWYFMAFLDYN